jgi:peptidyl-dipeptidase Dcp
MTNNPLLNITTDMLGLPAFRAIQPEHFMPAFRAEMEAQLRAIDAITANPEPPSFANTIVPLERKDLALDYVAGIFFHLSSASTNDALQAIEREITPLIARHNDQVYLNEALFRRIDAVWQQRAGLGAEEAQVVDRYHTRFTRAGAGLDGAAKARLKTINERLATLSTSFSQNVLADEKSFMLVLEGEDDLAGLPDFVVTAAAEAAAERNLTGKHVITLSRSSIEPFLTFSTRRDLRAEAFGAWTRRGEFGGASDNRALIAETTALRAERARLMGYRSFADFKLADTMAKTPAAVSQLLSSVWEPARARVATEHAALQRMASSEGSNEPVVAADWRHYAEKVRKAAFDFDEAELKPYFQLDNMIAAAFDTAHRLFGLGFEEVRGLDLYHPDVRVWRVTGREGQPVGTFLADYFARTSKRSGAWMSALRTQHRLDGNVRPVIVNVMNFAKAPKGQPTLLSFDDARTLFHEFGHALHGMLSDVTYPLISGTHVARDFVELPSQLYEHWLEAPDLLRTHARHATTGAPIPDALLDKVLAARRFNQGFATVEYASSAIVDLDLHMLEEAEGVDVLAVEQAALKRIGMPDYMVMRHRSPHFSHIFGGGYASGYYSYLWSEVLDADAFEAFEETGDVFDPATAKKLHDHIYSAGYRQDPGEAYKAFRGKLPTADALLRKRGLD